MAVDQDSPGPSATPRASDGEGTVLVVEDEGTLRGIVSRVLREQGYDVLSAADAREAIRRSRDHGGSIRLLLTDVVMPGGISGKDLANTLCPERPDMAVLFMSGYTDSAIVHHGVLDPNVAFLKKPFDSGALVAKVQEVIATHANGDDGTD